MAHSLITRETRERGEKEDVRKYLPVKSLELSGKQTFRIVFKIYITGYNIIINEYRWIDEW